MKLQAKNTIIYHRILLRSQTLKDQQSKKVRPILDRDMPIEALGSKLNKNYP